MNLSEASEIFLSLRKYEGFSPYTVDAYRLQHQLLIRDIGDMDIEDITLQSLRNHLNHNAIYSLQVLVTRFEPSRVCLTGLSKRNCC